MSALAVIEQLWIDDIEVQARSRASRPDAIEVLAESMRRIGLQAPITVRPAPENNSDQNWVLIAGAHRLEAAKTLGWEKIDGIVKNWDEVEARLWELAENLHRAELTEAERREHIARWVKLTAEKVRHDGGPSPGGKQPHERGINKAVKELGLPETTVRRAVAAESLSAPVKAAADAANLGTVARAAVAREPDAEAQLAAIRRRADRGLVKQAKTAAEAKAAEYIAQRQADLKPVTMGGLRDAIRDAVHATLGPPPPRPSRPAPPPDPPPANPVGDDFIDWVSAVKHLAESEADLLAVAVYLPVARDKFLAEARAALPRLTEWIRYLEHAKGAAP